MRCFSFPFPFPCSTLNIQLSYGHAVHPSYSSHPAQPFLPHRININCVALSRCALVCLSVCVLRLQLRCQRLKLNWFQVAAHLYFAGATGGRRGSGGRRHALCAPLLAPLSAQMRVVKFKKRIEAEQSKLNNHSAIRSDERTENREEREIEGE